MISGVKQPLSPSDPAHPFASPGGFEPPTCGLEGRCSIQLSYRDIVGGVLHAPDVNQTATARVSSTAILASAV